MTVNSLFTRYRAGDEEAGREIYLKYSRYIGAIIGRQMRDRIDEQQDLCQEVWRKVFASALNIHAENEAVFKGFLSTVTLNTLRDYYRRKKYNMVSLDTIAEPESPVQNPDDRAEASEIFRAFVAGLNDDERAVLTLYFAEGRTNRETADMLEMKERRVKYLIKTIRNKARADVRIRTFCRI